MKGFVFILLRYWSFAVVPAALLSHERQLAKNLKRWKNTEIILCCVCSKTILIHSWMQRLGI